MSTRIKALIKALLEKTTAAGCTEAEALAAAEKAAELMRNHGLAPEDLVMAEESIGRLARSETRHTLYRIIAAATNTVLCVGSDDLSFVGRVPGPDIAIYLRIICDRAMDRATRKARTSAPYRSLRKLAKKRAFIADFETSMMLTLADRILTDFAATKSEAAHQEVVDYLMQQKPGAILQSGVKIRDARNMRAAAMGTVAGKQVPLNQGVRDGGDRKLIGG